MYDLLQVLLKWTSEIGTFHNLRLVLTSWFVWLQMLRAFSLYDIHDFKLNTRIFQSLTSAASSRWGVRSRRHTRPETDWCGSDWMTDTDWLIAIDWVTETAWHWLTDVDILTDTDIDWLTDVDLLTDIDLLMLTFWQTRLTDWHWLGDGYCLADWYWLTGIGGWYAVANDDWHELQGDWNSAGICTHQ